MLTPAELKDLIQGELLPAYNRDKARLDTISAWLNSEVQALYIPRGADAEYQLIAQQSKFNVLKLIVKQLAQDLFVDGYRPTASSGLPSGENAPIWDMVWQPNRMDARQRMPHKAAIQFGWSYATVLPGLTPVSRPADVPGGYETEAPVAGLEQPTPVITPYSPRRFVACYDDPFNDEWPTAAMAINRAKPKESKPGPTTEIYDPDIGAKLTVFDSEYVYHVTKSMGGGNKATWNIIKLQRHGLGRPPVVRWLDEWDCDEMPTGKIWPLIDAQKQLNQTTFHILMIQNFASWRQRFIAGMEEEDPRFRARIDAVWKSTDPNTKFGEFAASDPTPLIRSREAELQFISAVAQVAPHQLVLAAGISNISADALVALQTSHDHDRDDHQISFGESTEQLLRLGGLAIANTPGATAEQVSIGRAAWEDTSAQVVWRDTTPRSLAQIADALGKLATQLGIPPEALWERIPGATQQDIERWKEMRDQADVVGRIESMLAQEDGEVEAMDPEEEPVPVGVAGNGTGPG